MAIGHQMFKTDINWGKIVALYAVAGGLAVDCIHQGHPEFLHGIMEGMTEILEANLGEWIATNGGWVSLNFNFSSTIVHYFRLRCARSAGRSIKKSPYWNIHP